MARGPDIQELRRLADGACTETLSDENAETLAVLLRGDKQAQEFYLKYIRLHSELQFHFRGQQAHRAVLGAIQAQSPPSPPSSSSRLLPATFHGATANLSSGWPAAYLIATVILGVGLFVGGLIRISSPAHLPQPIATVPKTNPQFPIPNPSSVVARITGMVDCVWERTGNRGQGAGTASLPSPSGGHHEVVGAGGEGRAHRLQSLIPNPQSLISLGDTLALRSGLLELTYYTGARVILQGPVTYEVESPAGGYLSVGKLTARLEKTNLPSPSGRGVGGEGGVNSPLSTLHSPLFAVRTPTAIVTDLGTEFGVEVETSGATRSHVFRGSIKVQRRSANGTGDDTGQILHENQSVRVAKDRDEKVVVASNVKSSDFIREIPRSIVKVFDLVDVVAGGNGFSGRRNRGIDSTTGQPISWAVSQLGHFPTGDGRYHRAEAMPFVDGVFVPDGRNGPVQLDSAGHAFGEFVTNTKEAGRYIWAGGVILSDDSTPSPKVETRLGNVDYASAGHGYLSLCANNGITFDLQAIRRANPGCRLLRFCAAAGNAETDSRDSGRNVYADLRVFVDGEVRFRRREINGYSGVFSIVIPIGQNDRYLTLTSTDAGNGIGGDDVLFGDPRLEMSNENGPVRETLKSQQGLSKEYSN